MHALRSPRPRGLSLVELLVGIALGLFVIAAATTLLAAQWREQRQLATEARLMQDLRTASDIVTRDVRRAGAWGGAAASGVAANPYAAWDAPAGGAGPLVYRYTRDAVENGVVDANEQFGLRLRNGSLEIALGAGQWQALTDAGTLSVTALELVPTEHTLSLEAHCAVPCPSGSTTCPPVQRVRRLGISITARSVLDPGVVRSLRSDVRLRNDVVAGACPD
jgi:prepilin peptidase dependent protein B